MVSESSCNTSVEGIDAVVGRCGVGWRVVGCQRAVFESEADLLAVRILGDALKGGIGKGRGIKCHGLKIYHVSGAGIGVGGKAVGIVVFCDVCTVDII